MTIKIREYPEGFTARFTYVRCYVPSMNSHVISKIVTLSITLVASSAPKFFIFCNIVQYLIYNDSNLV